VAYGYVSTVVKFNDGFRVPFTKHALAESLEKRLGDRTSVQLVIGATVDGELAGVRVDPGPFATVGVSYRLVDEGGWRPFVLAGGSLGGSWARVGGDSMTALDGRISLTSGKTLADVVTFYGVARAFGLPVFYGGRTGTDAYHYQLGAGLSVRLGGADLLFEGVPLGEQAITGGLGFAF
jgi:hypothetical protein